MIFIIFGSLGRGSDLFTQLLPGKFEEGMRGQGLPIGPPPPTTSREWEEVRKSGRHHHAKIGKLATPLPTYKREHALSVPKTLKKVLDKNYKKMAFWSKNGNFSTFFGRRPMQKWSTPPRRN
jgi:hypothetical protein